MKTAEAKKSSTTTHLQRKGNKPFFAKNGGESFFSKSDGTSRSFFHSLGIQTKLSIGQPNDKYEVEADAMADNVVQRLSTPEVLTQQDTAVQTKPLAATITPLVQTKCAACDEEEKLQKKEEEDVVQELPLEIQRKPIFESNAEPVEDSLSRKGRGEAIQRKCAECEKEEKLQKKSNAAYQTPLPNIESKLSSSKGSGSPLPDVSRSQMENSFGADFSKVRIHNDSSAIQMSKDLNAHAFTHGSDVYFNSGKYDTSSTGGKHLLAHELTHTVQQLASPPVIRKFGSGEHKELGDSTGVLIDIGDGVQLTFGDIVALAGDQYANPEELFDDTKTSDGRAKIRAHLESAQISSGTAALLPKPTDKQTKDVETNYYMLALNNISHFLAGGTAFDNWFFQHSKAVKLAMEAGLQHDPQLMNKANFTEAFAGHYLTDAFSSGHIRTPRKEINDYYVNEFAPTVYDHIINTLMERFVDEIYDQVEKQTIKNELAYLLGPAGGLGVRAYMRKKIRNAISKKLNSALLLIGGRKIAIGYLGQILGGVISLAMHDRENERGLWVSSKAHPEAWQAFGDSNLSKNSIHKMIILKAIQTSLSDLQSAYAIGLEESQKTFNLPDNRFLPQKIYFEFNSAELSASNLSLISSLGDYMLYHPSTAVSLHGNSDPIGTIDFNYDLGLRRANSVLYILLGKGIESGRISTKSFGEENMVSHNPKNYKLNRRVEIIYESRQVNDQRSSDDIAYDKVVRQVENAVGPRYAAEDHFPTEVLQSSGTDTSTGYNEPLPEWKWGKMDESLKNDLNQTLKGYIGQFKDKISSSAELNDMEVDDYTVSPRPIVKKIMTELAQNPLGFLGSIMGKNAN